MDDTPPPAAATFVLEGDRRRSEIVQLEWPVEFDGRVYRAIQIRRMSAAEVDAFVEEARVNAGAARLPMFSCPHEVIDGLDPDDAARVNETVLRFLPRALRPAE